MKKAKIACGILTSLLCVGALTACNDVKYSNQGYILTYKASDGSEKHYTADDLFKTYYTDADKTQTMFDSIYKLIVKNEFATSAKADEYKSIKELAARDVDGDKQTAKKNADTNGTSYDTEFDSILSGKGCKDEEELLQYYIYERESEQFEDDFYDNNMAVLRGENVEQSGKLNDKTSFDGYIKTMVPYHISHILVKIDDENATKYWNGTIGEQDCYDIYKVVNALAKGDKAFSTVAGSALNEDDTARSNFGDLGIMDKSTSFVDEFKLGIYAFENIYNKSITHADYREKVQNSNIGMSEKQRKSYIDWASYNVTADYTAPSMPTIKYEDIDKYFNEDKETCIAKVTKGYGNASVLDDNSLFYPRNVYYNEYLNKHAPSLITYDGGDLENFQDIFGDGKKYLCAKSTFTKEDGTLTYEYSPILVVRAGADSYQGIHFIKCNRSAFITKDNNGCTLGDYYTTYFPGQTNYPTRFVKGEEVDQQTYVNFNNLDVTSSKDRADTLKSSIKEFDKNLQKRIYQVYKDKITFTADSQAIGTAIDDWIKVSIAKTKFDDAESFDKTVNNYIDNLHQQSNERKKRLATIAAVTFDLYNNPAYGTQKLSAVIGSLPVEKAQQLQDALDELAVRYATPADASSIYADYADWTEFSVKESINDLYNKIGGLCNDGKTH